MKSKTIITIVLAVIVALVIIVVLMTAHKNTSQTATQTTATSTLAIPGDNLALGEDKSATYGTYLIGYNGMPLYTYAQDYAKVSYCKGACATVWKPYVVTATSSLNAESPITGKIAWLTRDDGSTQLTYDGHPLYFYAYDATSTVKGAGLKADWKLARP